MRNAYPRLPETLDLRRKLLSSDIVAIRKEFETGAPYHNRAEIGRRMRIGLAWNSEAAMMRMLAAQYNVSYHTIYYWVKDEYRKYKQGQNALAHSKADMSDYVQHRERESKARVERWRRYYPQWRWHARESAKSEKRSRRHSVLGETL